MINIVGRQKPEEVNGEDWGKLMETYNNDLSLIDGFIAGFRKLRQRIE